MTTKAKAAPKKRANGNGNGKKNGTIQLQGGSTVTHAALAKAVKAALNSGPQQPPQQRATQNRNAGKQQDAIIPAPLGAMYDGFHPGNALATRPRMRYDKSLHVPTIGFEKFTVPAGSEALVVFVPPQFRVADAATVVHTSTGYNYAHGTEASGKRVMICPLTALVFLLTESDKAALLSGSQTDAGLEAAHVVTLTTLGTCGAADLSIDRLSLSLRNTTPAVERGGSIKSLRANGPLALELADTQPTTLQASMLSPDFGYMVSKKSIALTMQAVAEHPLRSMYHGEDLGTAMKINSRPLDPIECDQFYPLSSTASGNTPVFIVTDNADNDTVTAWPGDAKGYAGALIRNIGAFHNPFHAGASRANVSQPEWGKGQAYNYGDPAWTPVCIAIEAGTKAQSYEVTCKGGLSAHFQQSSFLAPMQKPRKIVSSDAAAGANAMEGAKESTMVPVKQPNGKDIPAKIWDFVTTDRSQYDPRDWAGNMAMDWVKNNPDTAKGYAIAAGKQLLRGYGLKIP